MSSADELVSKSMVREVPEGGAHGLDAGAPTDFYTRKDSDDAIAGAERIVGFAHRQVG